MSNLVDDSKMESTTPYQQDGVREELAALLSRLASLQGVAVPAHRFVYQQEAESGVALEDMPLVDQAVAIWNERFPEGPITKLSISELVKSDFPVFWVSADGEQLKLLRGKQNGEYIAEGSDWKVDSVSEEDMAEGQVIQLLVHQDQSLQTEMAGFSAKDWFV